MSEERLAQARAWMRQDPDHETRDQLAGIITVAPVAAAVRTLCTTRRTPWLS